MSEAIIHGFLLQANPRFADNLAVDSRTAALTYAQLQDSVARLAAALRNLGAGPRGRIAVCLPKRVYSVQVLLATLFNGSAYVPIDYTAPAERIGKIINDAEVDLVVTLPEIAAALQATGMTVPVFSTDAEGTQIQALIAATAPVAPEVADPDALAAILYTSGSTGNPKGVMLSHRNIYRFSAWVVETYQLDSTDKLISHAPFHFDLSTMDLYSTFMVGASVYIFDEVEKRFPSTLTKVVQEKRITSWYSVPSALMLVEEKGALDKRDLSSLKRIFFAGEVYPLPALRRLMQRFPAVVFANLYGPTETNVCTYFTVDTMPGDDQNSIPIGKCCEHYELLIVDENDMPLGVGEKGEIIIVGDGVMQGYWHAEEKTRASRYRHNPLSYRTGDYGRLDTDGNVWYLGRLDSQVKIQGYRVELSEIENVANTHPAVKECAAIVLEQNDIKTIYLAAAPETGQVVTEDELLSWCARQIPVYAVPAAAFIFAEFGRTSTGKIDRQKVRADVNTLLHGTAVS